jgi:hypothetical protein
MTTQQSESAGIARFSRPRDRPTGPRAFWIGLLIGGAIVGLLVAIL